MRKPNDFSQKIHPAWNPIPTVSEPVASRHQASNQPATVATKVTDPRGDTGSPKTGYTIFARAPYDGVGATRAYDRATQKEATQGATDPQVEYVH